MGRTLDITSYTLEDRDMLSDRKRSTSTPGSGTTWSGGRWSAWPRPD